MVKDEYGSQYLVASLAYDDNDRGDLLTIKMSTMQQFTYKKKAHSFPIMSLCPLQKHDQRFLASQCFGGTIKLWKVGFNQ